MGHLMRTTLFLAAIIVMTPIAGVVLKRVQADPTPEYHPANYVYWCAAGAPCGGGHVW